MAQPIPPKLYKFQSVSDNTIKNLRNRHIYFSKPEKLNDPFDCAIPFVLGEAETQDELQEAFGNLLKRIQNEKTIDDIESAIRKAKEQFLTNGKANQKFRNEVIRISKLSIDEVRQEYKELGIACFSKVAPDNNILMWSHYADGHRGICLEFDTRYSPFNEVQKVLKVKYDNAYPVVSPA